MATALAVALFSLTDGSDRTAIGEAALFGNTSALVLYNFASCGPPLDGEIVSMAGQGSTGNVIAALCSFFIPGLGQLLQGRLLMAVFQFVLAAVLWFILLGWLVHLWSILDAALYKPRA